MAAILDFGLTDEDMEEIILQEKTYSLYNTSKEKDDRVSIWVKNGDTFKPSENVSIIEKLPPGMYSVEYNSNAGYYCVKEDFKSDELFNFTETVSDFLIPEISKFWEKKDLFKENNIIHKRGILLYGLPGTGKSSYINLLCEDLTSKGGIVFKINGVENLLDYIQFVRGHFRKIEKDTNIITILEDIDQYGQVQAVLLDFLDGHSHIENHVIIATSNNTEDIPDTFFRPSRLDIKIEVPLPSFKTRKEYFKFKKVEDGLLDELAEKTKGCSLADLKEVYICTFMLDYNIDDAVEQVKEPYTKKDYTNSTNKGKKIGFG